MRLRVNLTVRYSGVWGSCMKDKPKSTVRKPRRKKVAANSKDPSGRFVNDLLVREEAAQPLPDGTLPLTATHAITKENEDGTVEVKRARFKLF